MGTRDHLPRCGHNLPYEKGKHYYEGAVLQKWTAYTSDHTPFKAEHWLGVEGWRPCNKPPAGMGPPRPMTSEEQLFWLGCFLVWFVVAGILSVILVVAIRDTHQAIIEHPWIATAIGVVAAIIVYVIFQARATAKQQEVKSEQEKKPASSGTNGDARKSIKKR